MKNFLVICTMAFASLTFMGTQDASAQVNSNYTYVEGYYKSNGTYVQGHYRTNPNSTINDNYSTYPNTNPWTGEEGTIAPVNSYFYVEPTYIDPWNL